VLDIVRLIFNFISEKRRSRKVKLTYSEEFCNVHGFSSIVLVLLYGG
jgi:hypothetical protein